MANVAVSREECWEYDKSDEAGAENAAQMEETTKELEEKEYTASSGGGA